MSRSCFGKCVVLVATWAAATPFLVTDAAAQSLIPTTFLNLRAGPDKHAPVIGALQPGMPVRPLAGTADGWLQVNTPDATGWALGYFVRE